MARLTALEVKSRGTPSVDDKASSSSSKKPIFTPQSDIEKVITEITTKSLANLPEPKTAQESEPEKRKGETNFSEVFQQIFSN